MKEAGFKEWKTIPLTQAVGDQKPLKSSSTSPTTITGKDGMQAVVYEVWWKPERKVYFIADGYDEICKEVDDPLKLEGFFPMSMPGQCHHDQFHHDSGAGLCRKPGSICPD